MQCPYCAEKIKGEAVVCAHCGHDVGVIKPLMLRLVELESRVRKLSRRRDRPARPARRSWVIPAFGVVAGLLWTTTAYLVGNPPEGWPANLPHLLLSLLPPAVFGLGTGAVWRSGSWLLNLGAGLVLGLVDLAAVLAVLSGVGTLVFNWPWALAVFNVGQPAIFATACWIGETASASLPLTRPRLKELGTSLRFLWALALQALAQVATAFAHVRLIQEGL